MTVVRHGEEAWTNTGHQTLGQTETDRHGYSVQGMASSVESWERKEGAEGRERDRERERREAGRERGRR